MKNSLSGRDMVLLAMASFRATRLIVQDDLPPIQAARDWLIAKAGKDSTFAEGISCGWCSGVHVAWILVCLATRKPPWRLTFRDWILVGALSATTGLLGTADGAMGRSGGCGQEKATPTRKEVSVEYPWS
jgi:hypothetical protein